MSSRGGELHDHHLALERLFKRLVEAVRANASQDVASLWTEFDAGLRQHFAFEETLLIPKLHEVDPVEADALVAEHRELERMLGEFAVQVDLHLLRAEVVEAFIRTLREHAAREDRLFYPWIDRQIADPEQAGLRARVEQQLARLLRPAS